MQQGRRCPAGWLLQGVEGRRHAIRKGHIGKVRTVVAGAVHVDAVRVPTEEQDIADGTIRRSLPVAHVHGWVSRR
ncbi:hypothetical protein D3C71_2019500 [compost metagenome]